MQPSTVSHSLQKSAELTGIVLDVQLKQLIKAVGLKVTVARLLVLHYFYQQAQQGETTHISHAELVEQLPPSGIDKVTIYRNLNDLANANLLLKQNLGDTLWRYSYHRQFCASVLEQLSNRVMPTKVTTHAMETVGITASRLHAHPHFVCTQCHKLDCLPLAPAEIPQGWQRKIAKIEEVTVRGICQLCS
jgi:Fur family ferric uptake transcriptional regulator